MAYTTIDDPSAHFHIQLYVGNQSTNAITNNANAGNFQPDWWWGADRTGTSWNSVYDSSRGTTKQLNSNVNNSEYTVSTGLTSFDSNGFTLGSHDNSNGNSENHVAWQWKANGGTTTTNDASSTGVGTIDSVYQANTTAGFSIVTHTGSGSAGNIAHGLGAVPEWVVTKNRTDNSQSWANYHVGIGAQYYLELDTSDPQETASSVWGDTTPSSTTFRVGGANGKNNASSKNYVSYCFTPIQGYSKFGSYTGNGNADGPFVYLGFKPAFIMWKGSSIASNWVMFDSKRETFNLTEKNMQANETAVENSNLGDHDMLSNGFKIRSVVTNDTNVNGQTYIYIAFAESPFVSSEGVPTTAR